MKVLVTDNVNAIAEEILKKEGIEAVVMKTPQSEMLCEIIKDFDGIIVRNSTKLTKEVLDCAKNLKIIARAGVGVDNIDVDYAAEKGIWVVNSPNGNTEATAEHTIAMLLSLARKIPQAYETIKDGRFERSKFLGTELLGKTLGIAGFGKIGKRVAEIAKVFGMEILVYDPFAEKDFVEGFGYKKYDDLEKLMNANVNDIEDIIREIGTYHKKALFVKEIAKSIYEYGGYVPNDRKFLEGVKGVGHKTCNVVLANLFDEPAMAVDTHVKRVSERLGVSKSKDSVLDVEKKLMKKVPRERWNRTHHQLVLFGRYKCKAISPLCSECKIKDFCNYKRKTGK